MAKKNKGIWSIVDNFQGDKIIWMIVLLLIMISILAISSSTPLLALQTKSTRSAIINEQIVIAALGLGVIIFCYTCIRRIGFLRFVSQLGFAVSLFMLLCLAVEIKTPFLRAVRINGAVRILQVFGFQLHVFEFVKVFMVMYLAWACHTYKEGTFTLAGLLSEYPHFAFLKKKSWQLFFYVFLPVFMVMGLTLKGSVSSTLFTGLVMFATILVGGIRFKDFLIYLVIGLPLAAGVVGLAYLQYDEQSDGNKGSFLDRIPTAINRVVRSTQDPEKQLLELDRGTPAFQEALDKVKQPISAKVAVSEGGLIGKGPGRSTQRYVVPVMFEDYMFSFIVEEYGILGALLVIILYGTLLARGWIIAKNCTSHFAKTAVAGLILTISGQAMMHMFINVDLGPLTGQTLPMISHGASSFLAFSLSFGIILCISKMVKKKVEKEVAQMKPILEAPQDDVRDRLEDLDILETID